MDEEKHIQAEVYALDLMKRMMHMNDEELKERYQNDAEFHGGIKFIAQMIFKLNE